MSNKYITSDDGGATSRPMTNIEIATYDALVADWVKEKSDQDKIASQKALAKQAVLTKLGLTADEVTALLS